MGRQEELQTITTTSLGTLIQARIAEEIETVAREKRVADQVTVVSREIVGKPTNTLDIYKRTSVKIGRVLEGGEFPTAEPTYTRVSTIRAYKEGGNSHLTHEAIRDGRVDLINDCKTELGEGLANRKDFLIWRDGAFNGVEQTAEPFTGDGTTKEFTLSAGALPVCDVLVTVAEVEVTPEKFDPKTGKVTLTEAPASDAEILITPWKVTCPTKASAAAGTLTVTDILAGRLILVGKKQWPDTLVCTMNTAQAFLGQTEFTDIAKYGELAKTALLRGEIGRVYDLQTLPSTVIPEGLALILRRKSGIVHVEKEGIRVRLKEREETDSTDIYASETYGNGLKNVDTVVAMVIGFAA